MINEELSNSEKLEKTFGIDFTKSEPKHDKRREKAKRDYRLFANITEDFKVTEDNIDDWALREAANKYNVQPYDLKKELLKEEVQEELTEDVTIDQAARELEAEKAAVEDKNQVEKVLDRSLKIAKRMRGADGDFPNVLLIGDAGFAKTDMVRQWAKNNGINLVKKDVGTMNASDLGGIVARDPDDPKYATKLGTNEMAKALSRPNSVLFLDEYNRSRADVRSTLLTLVQNHIIWDPNEENSTKYLDNFLFTIAAINPPNSAYRDAKQLDPAEMSRFYSVTIQPDPAEHLRYLKKEYTKLLNNADKEDKLEYEGKLKLAETILTDESFYYDTTAEVQDGQDDPQYRPLNYRSFKLALDRCDGTKADLLDIWSHYCNYKKKSLITTILSEYQDVEDKATDALKGGTTSDVFAKTMTNREKLAAAFPELGL